MTDSREGEETASLEERNSLFRSHSRVDVSKLPQPQFPGEVIVEQVAGKGQNNHPLVFSEKNPLPSRGDRWSAEKPSEERARTIHQASQNKVTLGPEFFDNPEITLGAILTEARKQAGMTLEKVSAQTRITLQYLSALEDDSAEEKLPRVFISAYVRALCRLYCMDEPSTELAMKQLQAFAETHADVPTKIIEDIESEALVNEEEEKRIRRFIYIGIGVLAVFVVLVLWGIIMALFPSDRSSAQGADESERLPVEEEISSPADMEEPSAPSGESSSFNADNLRVLNAPQFPEASVLELSRRPQVRR